jgi:hypothetical protein
VDEVHAEVAGGPARARAEVAGDGRDVAQAQARRAREREGGEGVEVGREAALARAHGEAVVEVGGGAAQGGEQVVGRDGVGGAPGGGAGAPRAGPPAAAGDDAGDADGALERGDDGVVAVRRAAVEDEGGGGGDGGEGEARRFEVGGEDGPRGGHGVADGDLRGGEVARDAEVQLGGALVAAAGDGDEPGHAGERALERDDDVVLEGVGVGAGPAQLDAQGGGRRVGGAPGRAVLPAGEEQTCPEGQVRAHVREDSGSGGRPGAAGEPATYRFAGAGRPDVIVKVCSLDTTARTSAQWRRNGAALVAECLRA